MKRTVWTFGLISGGILSIVMLASMRFQDTIGFDRAEVVGYTSMVVSFLFVFFGVRSYRENVGNRSLSFGRALAVGALISLIACLCYVATWELVFYKLSPDFSAKYQAYAIEHAKSSGSSQAEIDKKIADARKFMELYQNPLVNAAVTFLEPLPVALVFTLVSAGILRRKPRDSAPMLAAPGVAT
jgi:uncharacterized protein DUF4199